jgi:prepilin-type processing-associated H-X9-DG protein
MHNRNGLTRVDLAVALACIVLVAGQAAVINAGGCERSKKEVCLANLRSLAAAWQTYSNDNRGKIPVGDVKYSWVFPDSAGGPQLAWFEWPEYIAHPMPPAPPYIPYMEEWEHSIARGTMWKYIGDYTIYRCPSAGKDYYVTYTMSQSMNTYPDSGGTGSPIIRNINQIIKPAEKLVFMDNGSAKQGAFYVSYNSTSNLPGRWYDPPPMIHNQGTTFVFADGHAIYRQWTDPHTLQALSGSCGGGTVDYCDCDLRWITQITWGSVPFTCPNPAKNCEY